MTFITYSQALSLKELGFRDECLYYYNTTEQIILPNTHYVGEEEGFTNTEDLYKSFNYLNNSKIDAPTLSQTQEWLRENKNLFVFANIKFSFSDSSKFFWNITNRSGHLIKESDYDKDDYDSYEDALSSGISRCLKYLEDNDNDF